MKMKLKIKVFQRKVSSLIGVVVFLAHPLFNFAQAQLDRTLPKLSAFNLGRGRGNNTDNTFDKLAPELRTLYSQFTTSRGSSIADESGLEGYTSDQLSGIFGINKGERNPLVTVAVHFSATGDFEAIKKAGGSVLFKHGKTIYAVTPVHNLGNLAGLSGVQTINAFKAMQIPSPFTENQPPELVPISRGGNSPAATPLANEFNKQGLTGKAVIIGVIDSGIDWQHPDFIHPDGTSRILALWDLSDDSYQKTSGKVGSKPPVYLEAQKVWFGTVYTNEQINAALKGKGNINSFDRFGHGTAVAGTAAGSGRPTSSGLPAGSYTGVAPEADLIVVKAMDCGFFVPSAEITAQWITEQAKQQKKPVVINMSFGGQFSTHDGSTDGEQFIDSLTGAGKPGIVVTVAAGNDGRFNLHATGRFGPKRPGQADNFSPAIELFVRKPTRLLGIFDSKDDWGLAFRSTNSIFTGADGKQIVVYIYKTAAGLDFLTSAEPKDPEGFKAFTSNFQPAFATNKSKPDLIQMQLPKGDYIWWGYGTSPNVKNGNFDFYTVDPAALNNSSFGMGAAKTGIVGSPGNAANAITVGSFDFRKSWKNQEGAITFYNLQTGGISDYTSPGFRRDGVVKPDISAPARYTISPLSQFSRKEKGGCQESMAMDKPVNFTAEGNYLAWAGTSAAAPFTAGVIALMLQKNPNLDSAQIKQILQRTAQKDNSVGVVPNPAWGWGKIDPAAALASTPAATAKPLPVRKQVKGK